MDISEQTYLDYLAWCAQARIPSRMVLSEKEYLRQVSSLATTRKARDAKRRANASERLSGEAGD
jgi:lipase chaperone LimK